MTVQYVPYNEIDKIKWDTCIDTAGNGLIYAYSFYLDGMSKNWDALVYNDYEYIMPLTWNKKYGIYYLYQPFFTASLGLFGKNITAKLLHDFLNAIPGKFRYWDIYLNNGNYFQLPGYELYERMNYVLPLQDSYETIYANYRENVKRNIKKANQLGCTIKKGIDIDEIITLATELSRKFSPVSTEDYIHLKKIYHQLQQQKKAISYAVYSSSNELLASCVFFLSNKRAYYILVGNHPNGKTNGASHALIDAFIREFCGQYLLLDFEGSDIPNLAFFYSSFGAKEEKYVGLKLNRLPFWISWLKR